MDNSLFALMLSVLAGAATCVGSAAALFARRQNTKFLAASLGFSAGVMLYVSMVEIFSKAKIYLCAAVGDIAGYWITVAGFFAGTALIFLIDYFLPSADGDIGCGSKSRSASLKRIGVMTALAMAIHNFPEGLATFTSALKDPHLGVAIAVAIAIHNIPEGIATSAPIYFSTGSRKKAFGVSVLSGLTEPVGALLGYLILRPFFTDAVFGALFSTVAGIMVFIALEELLPMAKEVEKSKTAIIGAVSGMAVMAVSLVLFA